MVGSPSRKLGGTARTDIPLLGTTGDHRPDHVADN